MSGTDFRFEKPSVMANLGKTRISCFELLHQPPLTDVAWCPQSIASSCDCKVEQHFLLALLITVDLSAPHSLLGHRENRDCLNGASPFWSHCCTLQKKECHSCAGNGDGDLSWGPQSSPELLICHHVGLLIPIMSKRFGLNFPILQYVQESKSKQFGPLASSRQDKKELSGTQEKSWMWTLRLKLLLARFNQTKFTWVHSWTCRARDCLSCWTCRANELADDGPLLPLEQQMGAIKLEVDNCASRSL